MNTQQVTFVRIYLTEKDRRLDELVQRLHDQEQVRGVTVFRGIEGFGESGTVHGATLVDLAMDLPVVIEFFDDATKVEVILEHLMGVLEPGHIVKWSAEVCE